MNWIFAPGCAACDRPVAAGQPMCAACLPSLYPIDSACPGCGQPIEGPVTLVCERCRRRPLPLERVVAPYRYGGELATALRRLKLGRRREVARRLAPLLAPVLAAAADGCDLLVPVPLHWRRRSARGFNQALLLARYAGPAHLPPSPGSLRRVRNTPPQRGLDRPARRTNVRRAFRVPDRHRARIAGRRIVLIDDVVTTGATMAAAARALRAAGAAEVVGFAAARAG